MICCPFLQSVSETVVIGCNSRNVVQVFDMSDNQLTPLHEIVSTAVAYGAIAVKIKSFSDYYSNVGAGFYCVFKAIHQCVMNAALFLWHISCAMI